MEKHSLKLVLWKNIIYIEVLYSIFWGGCFPDDPPFVFIVECSHGSIVARKVTRFQVETWENRTLQVATKAYCLQQTTLPAWGQGKVCPYCHWSLFHVPCSKVRLCSDDGMVINPWIVPFFRRGTPGRWRRADCRSLCFFAFLVRMTQPAAKKHQTAKQPERQKSKANGSSHILELSSLHFFVGVDLQG